MAYPSVTYTFSNGSTADASAVNTNFTDLINGLSDSTKDLSISALTCAGNATFNGNTTIGNASSDTLTVTASLASSVPIGTTFSYDLGSSTIGMRDIYFGSIDSAAKTTKIRAGTVATSNTLTLPITTGTLALYAAMTIQRFTSGSGTYTTPTGVKWLRVTLVGGGGGGGEAGGGTNGSAGGDTTFGSSLLTGAGGGGGSATAGTASTGGAATVSAPATTIVAVTGTQGGAGYIGGTGVASHSGYGGSSPFGGGGAMKITADSGAAAAANTGSGGSGGASAASGQQGSGGASGGYLVALITSPSATYAYAVGAGGAGGTGGAGADGGAGAAGIIIVEEIYG